MTSNAAGDRYVPGTYARKRPDTAQRARHFVRQWEQRKEREMAGGPAAAPSAPAICISRKIGVGALEIAELLSGRIGYRVADRIIIDQIATDAELGARTVAFFDERHPGKINELSAFLFGEKSFVMGDYMRKLVSAVFSLAESEPTIFVGRGAHLILPRDRVLAVRCICSRDYRIARVAGLLGISQDEARKELDEADKIQRRFFQKAFGKKDAPPDEFDLIINCDHLQPEGAAAVIQQAFAGKFPVAEQRPAASRAEAELV